MFWLVMFQVVCFDPLALQLLKTLTSKD